MTTDAGLGARVQRYAGSCSFGGPVLVMSDGASWDGSVAAAG